MVQRGSPRLQPRVADTNDVGDDEENVGTRRAVFLTNIDGERNQTLVKPTTAVAVPVAQGRSILLDINDLFCLLVSEVPIIGDHRRVEFATDRCN